MAVFSIWVFLSAVTGYPSVITGWDDPWENMIVALVLLLSARGGGPGNRWNVGRYHKGEEGHGS